MRFTRLRIFALLVAGLFPLLAQSALVWTAETGWRVEGGTLAPMAGPEARNALDLMNRAREAEERGSEGRALKSYRKVYRSYGKSVYAPEAYFRTAQIRMGQKRYAKAFTALQQIVFFYPSYERFDQVLGQQYRIATLYAEGARGKFLWVLPGFKNRSKAIQYYEQVVANAPFSDYAPLALMNVARLHHRLDDDESAIFALDRIINSYWESVLTPDAYLKLAQTHASLVDGPLYDQASTKEAITFFEDYMILFPGDPNISEAEKGLADMKTVHAESKMKIADFYYNKRSNLTAAKVFYNEAITTYPDSEVAARARARLDIIDARLAAAPKAEDGQPSTAPVQKKRKRFFFF
ncbi:MAG TPA: tetratricopeptide repeat protein [Opitutaceae bacterium]